MAKNIRPGLNLDPESKELVKILWQKLEAIEKKEHEQMLTDQFKELMVAHGVPRNFLKGVVVKTEEEIPALVVEVEKEYLGKIGKKWEKFFIENGTDPTFIELKTMPTD